MSPLIDPHRLHQRLDEVAVFDIRWDRADPEAGYRRYRQGHIPGAVFVDFERELSATDGPGRHPLARPADFAATLGRLGVVDISHGETQPTPRTYPAPASFSGSWMAIR